ncbi:MULTISPECIES: DUF1573 domain-containing protein [Pirellulaceae]|nr:MULTISPECIES: DUF1573 domain-containing protein [Pirellulaceae]
MMSRFAPLTVVLLILVVAASIWYAQPSNVPESGTTNIPGEKVDLTLTSSQTNHSPAQEPNDSKGESTSAAKPSPQASTPKANRSEERPGSTVIPKVRVDETVFDFGTLPRFTTGDHTFVIHNEGTAPLKIEQGPSSCSCTLIGLEKSEVPPGGKAEIRLEWTLKFKEGPFRQSAVVLTNDPDHKELEFVVKGLTENRFTLVNDTITFNGLAPIKEAMSQETIVYSRTLKEMDHIELETIADIPGMTIELEPASQEELDSLEARCGKKVIVTIPAGLEKGNYTGQIALKSTSAESHTSGDETQQAENSAVARLNIQAMVKKPGVKFFSPRIDGFGAVKLGSVSSKDGSEPLLINFRVDQGDTPWKVKDIYAWPEFVDAKVVTLDQEIGLFQLQIQIPPGAPPGNYYGQEIGRIVITSDHPLLPRIPSKQTGLWLDFHVE